MSTKVKTTTNPFLRAALAEANKTEIDVLTEKTLEFLENAVIDCELQIGERETGLKPRKQLQLKSALNQVKKAQQNLEKVEVTIPSNGSFETYFNNLTNAEEQLEDANHNVKVIKQEIEILDAEIAKLKQVLAKLNVK